MSNTDEKAGARSATKTYGVYTGMKQRCYNKKAPSYRHYGGRGIKVCARWLKSYDNFLADMGEKPKGRSIDRINNDGDYEPRNCRWATPRQQCLNRRGNRLLTINGETKPLMLWAEQYGIDDWTVFQRLRNGISPINALTKPVNGHHRAITFRGETMCLTHWANRLGISFDAMAHRLKHWPLEIALTRPIDDHKPLYPRSYHGQR